MKSILIFLSLLSFSFSSVAQTQEELYTLLTDLYTARQFKEAVLVAEKLIAITSKKGDNHPDHKESLVSLAMIYIEMQEYAKAETACLKLVEINRSYYGETTDEYLQSLGVLGIIYERKEDLNKAETVYKKIADTRSGLSGVSSMEYAIAVDHLADLYAKKENYTTAEPLYRRSLEIKTKHVGDKHLSYGKTANSLAKLYEVTGRYDKAGPLYSKAMAVFKFQLGEKSAEYVGSLFALASMYKNIGQYTSAKSQYILLTERDKEYLDQRNYYFAANIYSLAEVHEKLGEYAEAESLFIRAMDIRRRYVGENHVDYAASLNGLGMLYDAMGQYQKAEPLLIQASEIAKKVEGETHINYAICLDNLARLYVNMGLYNKAEALHIHAQKIKKVTTGQNSLSYAITLDNMARLYNTMGQYDKAEALYLQSKEIIKKVQGENHPDYATSLNNLGILYQEMSQYEKAENLFIQSNEIRKKALGENHPDYANSLNNIGKFYHDIGQYTKAEQLFYQAITILEKIQPENAGYAVSLSNLARLYGSIGQYEKSEGLYLQAKEILVKVAGDKHPDYAKALDNLAALYLYMGQYEKAGPLQIQAIEIWRKALGDLHPSYAASLSNLAFSYLSMGQYEKAELMYLQVRETMKKMLGESHPDYANSLNNLAFLYLNMGQYEKSIPLYIQSTEIIKKVLGETNPAYSDGLVNLALSYQNAGEPEKAEKLILQNSHIELNNLYKNFTILSEKEKGNYLSNKVFLLTANNSFLYNYKKASPSILQNNFNQQLVFKSLVLSDTRDVLLSVQQSTDTTVQRLLKNWQTNKTLLAKQYAIPIANRRPDLKQIEVKAENLEKELTRTSSAFRKQQNTVHISLHDVRKNMKPDEVAIEFVSFHLYNKKWTDSTVYAAYLLNKTDSLPVFIPLCEEKQLTRILSPKFVSNESIKALYRSEIAGEEEQKIELGDSLYALIWKPLLPYLKDIKKIDYSPAGLLYKVAFHALPTGDSQLLLDKYELRQYTSLRRITEDTVQTINEKNIVLFGDCAFTMDSTSTAPVAGRVAAWKNLPGTAREIKGIQALFDKNKIKTASYLQQAASEENLKSLSGNSPAILHLATHGFFLPDPEKKKKEGPLKTDVNVFASADDPLLRSGIVLAGANSTWNGQSSIPGREDGIVTAYEISQLDLGKTNLVVLSACETALGDIKGNEGVFGLQRAFKLAGVKNMLLSLWRVPDAETAELMTVFYNYYIGGKTVREAFNAAQKDMRAKYKPYYWAAFVLIE
ncbi:MAG: tetratricopeptide repeat protein [Bacteroidota bacterium]